MLRLRKKNKVILNFYKFFINFLKLAGPVKLPNSSTTTLHTTIVDSGNIHNSPKMNGNFKEDVLGEKAAEKFAKIFEDVRI